VIPIRPPTVVSASSSFAAPGFPGFSRARLLSAVGAFLVLCASIASPSAQQQAPDAVPVGTVKTEHKPIAKTKNFVGRVEAINKVEVHARVTGYLEDVLFKEGDFVKEGQHLYTIEKDQFQAAVGQAAGELADDKAKKLLTQISISATPILYRRSRAR